MGARQPGPTLVAVTLLVRPLVSALTRPTWAGTHHLPSGGFVLAANHISHADPLVIAHYLSAAGVPPRFLAKVEVLRVPFVGRVLRATGQIPVDRGTASAVDALAAATAAVRRGEAVVVYPEGTLTRDPDLWPMAGRTGAARLALRTGCPVIPLAQWGAQDILSPHRHRPTQLPPYPVHVRAGPPVDLDDLRSQPVTAALLQSATDRILDAVTAELELLRATRAPSTRTDPRRAAGGQR